MPGPQVTPQARGTPSKPPSVKHARRQRHHPYARSTPPPSPQLSALPATATPVVPPLEPPVVAVDAVAAWLSVDALHKAVYDELRRLRTWMHANTGENCDKNTMESPLSASGFSFVAKCRVKDKNQKTWLQRDPYVNVLAGSRAHRLVDAARITKPLHRQMRSYVEVDKFFGFVRVANINTSAV